MSHEKSIISFRKQFHKEYEQFPQLEYIFDNMFNAGYSAGLEYIFEKLNKS